MTDTLKASQAGLERVEKAIKQKGWGRQSTVWYDRAHVSLATLRRFWQRIPINAVAFQAICEAAEVDWQEVVDLGLSQPEVAAQPFDPDVWVGRTQLLDDLVQLSQQGCRLLLVTGITGVGKTALVGQLCDRLQGTFSVQRRIAFDNHDQTTFGHIATYLPGITLGATGPAPAPEETVKAVVTHLVNQPSVLVLDGLEATLQGNEDNGWSVFKDPLWKHFFSRLLTAPTCHSLVIVASQEFPVELREVGSRYQPYWHCAALRGLTATEQTLLFQRLGLAMDGGAEAEILQRIGSAYEGHPLTLQVIAGEILNQPFGGNLVAYWNTYGHEIEALEQAAQAMAVEGEDDPLRLDCYSRYLRQIVRGRMETTFNRLRQEVPSAYWLLCLASVYRRPVVAEFWLNLLAPLQPDREQQGLMLDALRDRYLVEDLLLQDHLHLRQHNLIRSIALSHLRQLRSHHDTPPASA